MKNKEEKLLIDFHDLANLNFQEPRQCKGYLLRCIRVETETWSNFHRLKNNKKKKVKSKP